MPKINEFLIELLNQQEAGSISELVITGYALKKIADIRKFSELIDKHANSLRKIIISGEEGINSEQVENILEIFLGSWKPSIELVLKNLNQESLPDNLIKRLKKNQDKENNSHKVEQIICEEIDDHILRWNLVNELTGVSLLKKINFSSKTEHMLVSSATSTAASTSAFSYQIPEISEKTRDSQLDWRSTVTEEERLQAENKISQLLFGLLSPEQIQLVAKNYIEIILKKSISKVKFNEILEGVINFYQNQNQKQNNHNDSFSGYAHTLGGNASSLSYGLSKNSNFSLPTNASVYSSTLGALNDERGNYGLPYINYPDLFSQLQANTPQLAPVSTLPNRCQLPLYQLSPLYSLSVTNNGMQVGNTRLEKESSIPLTSITREIEETKLIESKTIQEEEVSWPLTIEQAAPVCTAICRKLTEIAKKNPDATRAINNVDRIEKNIRNISSTREEYEKSITDILNNPDKLLEISNKLDSTRRKKRAAAGRRSCNDSANLQSNPLSSSLITCSIETEKASEQQSIVFTPQSSSIPLLPLSSSMAKIIELINKNAVSEWKLSEDAVKLAETFIIKVLNKFKYYRKSGKEEGVNILEKRAKTIANEAKSKSNNLWQYEMHIKRMLSYCTAGIPQQIIDSELGVNSPSIFFNNLVETQKNKLLDQQQLSQPLSTPASSETTNGKRLMYCDNQPSSKRRGSSSERRLSLSPT